MNYYAVINSDDDDPLALLRQANAAESWEWLTVNAPAHATAVEVAVGLGVTAEAIYRAMIKDTQRQEFARRCQLAARYLIDKRSD